MIMNTNFVTRPDVTHLTDIGHTHYIFTPFTQLIKIAVF